MYWQVAQVEKVFPHLPVVAFRRSPNPASSTGFSYFFLARLGDWERARRRERELVAIEERECRERWEGEKEGEKSRSAFPLLPMIPCAPPH